MKTSNYQGVPKQGLFYASKNSTLSLVVALLAVLAPPAWAQVGVSDDFESGNLNAWANTGGTSLAIDNTQNKVPAGGTFCAKMSNSANSMYRNLIGVVPDQTFKLTYYLYDSTMTRCYMEARAYAGGSYTNSALLQVCMIGKYNNVTMPGEFYDGTKYQARLAFGSPSGYFNLNGPGAPSRSTGWHRFDLERGLDVNNVSVVLNYYVDGILSRSFITSSTAHWDDVTMGFGSGTEANVAYFDGILVLNGQPFIQIQPTGITNFNGTDTSLTVQAIGKAGADLGYQWSRNGSNLPGKTDAIMDLASPQFADTGSYSVVITNSVSATTSMVAYVSIVPSPNIVSQPQSVLVNPGDTASFTVLANGQSSISYQWRRNGVNLTTGGIISGVDQATLNLSGVSLSDAGSYTVVASDGVNPDVISAVAILFINTPPTLGTVASGQVAGVGGRFTVQVSATDDFSVRGTPFADFESYASGAARVLFAYPGFSGTTGLFVDTNAPDFCVVTNVFPGNHASSKVLQARWSFLNGTTYPWVRLTTSSSGVTNTPNPVISFIQALRFDVYSDRDLDIAAGVRESNPTGAMGSDGGASSAAIEWVGATGKNATAPVTTRTLTGGTWTTLNFDMPNESIFSFASGNGALNSTTGLGLLEQLALSSPGGNNYGVFNVYLDNFIVVPTNHLTFVLESGPDGATIDPITGLISWSPTAEGNYNFTVHVADGGGLTSAPTTFSVGAVSPKITYSLSGTTLTLNWTGYYNLQSKTDLSAAAWTNVGVTTSPYITSVNTNAATFYRLQGP